MLTTRAYSTLTCSQWLRSRKLWSTHSKRTRKAERKDHFAGKVSCLEDAPNFLPCSRCVLCSASVHKGKTERQTSLLYRSSKTLDRNRTKFNLYVRTVTQGTKQLSTCKQTFTELCYQQRKGIFNRERKTRHHIFFLFTVNAVYIIGEN